MVCTAVPPVWVSLMTEIRDVAAPQTSAPPCGPWVPTTRGALHVVPPSVDVEAHRVVALVAPSGCATTAG